jgi:curved DNA-binding protein
VPTLEGKISVKIAPGSQAGQKLRVKGKGLVGKTGKGDLFVVLKIVMPPDRSPEVQALWRQLESKAAFDPRAKWGSGR